MDDMKEPNPADSWAIIFSDLVALIDRAPSPPHRPTREWTREDQAAAHAVVVAWGWLTRVKRSCSAVFMLEEASYEAESRPLTRSVIEHTIRLRWAADLELHVFVEVLLRIQRWSLDKTLEAAKNGWPLSPELRQAINESQAEASEDFKYLDTYHHLANVVATNPKEFSGLYQYWLLETQYSHPTLSSAEPYFFPGPESLGWTLRDRALPEDHRSDILLPSLLWLSAGAYGAISGLSSYFEDSLDHIGERMRLLGGKSP